MKSAMRISLRNGERIYINGAVLRVDRKVGIELLNDVTFLLESQVMQAADATTPLRQLYFVVQLMLMNPADTREASELVGQLSQAMHAIVDDPIIQQGLRVVEALVPNGRYYEALKTIRALFPLERALLDGVNSTTPTQAA
jgi:flagellar biosynthesis repressor protein FlbT